ncbi:zinc ABC transporter substrate-binding protein [Vibrio sp. 10N.286.49.C2]|uniref:zinc ABC transporter substrate-binding protein ZnuA n=1 Tax=unclassified Vibrio TaxID=2614977 RepID=UPI000C85F1B2|nr:MULTISPECIES: zinc ABC transporter substrate-binding protein ZnuA [unclassified Vibrio]PMH38937.1 zinc ABC transporter substrate-binding protein [Vibrio sp. 10N.286.49.C2]PMH55411.1 zinc ABC transporter substrate-binding protein [Vibrio sp. 10N.286.49.B1]PMH80864.1 zinc ABC transporter substrate-binding protein [Vibrio sp. 10N.286.48.B7]
MYRYISTVALATLIPMKANAFEVLSSIKPFEMISHELILDGQTTSSLLNANASPHDYAMKPSDVKRLRSSDLVVWFGPDLESFLAKSLDGNTNVVKITDIDGLPLREFGSDDHGHEGHHHGSYDPHVWLGPAQAVIVAQAISQKLIEVDPDNQEKYAAKLADFKRNLSLTEDKIKHTLAPIKEEGYYVFHDAYGYFESYFGLNNLGHFTVSPERKPGAKTLINIKSTLKSEQVKCVFAEPQYTPAVIETVTRGTGTHIGRLDPLGTDIAIEKGSYFTFLESISMSYSDCLLQE